MATFERRPLMTFKDKNGDKHLMYPITKVECVDGLDTLLAAKETPAGAQTKVDAVQANLNAHSGNSTHASSAEKSAWNAKETPAGAQAKVDAHNTASTPHANMGWAKKSELAAIIPVGAILLWSGAVSAIPAGWKLCDGANGTPDLRGRFVVGAGSTYAVGSKGGLDSVSLTVYQLPEHFHNMSLYSENGTDYDYNAIVYQNAVNKSEMRSSYTSKEGTSQAHENRPPYYALCYIMYKGA